jgi:methenyltetrahydrofolate cyclohydrolase
MGLTDQSTTAFVQALASESPVPGGGSAAALEGALGVALAAKFCRTLIGKEKYATIEHQAREILEEAERLQSRLLALVDEDAEDFEPLAAAFHMPNGTDAEKAARTAAIQAELKQACGAPLQIMRCCREGIRLHDRLAELGIKRSADNLGVGVQQMKAALIGGELNVLVNTVMIHDADYVARINDEVHRLRAEGSEQADQVLERVLQLLSR